MACGRPSGFDRSTLVLLAVALMAGLAFVKSDDPPKRFGATITKVGGGMVMFGGYSFSGPPAVDPPETGEYDATTQGLKNDLWRFSLADGNWTQIDAGSDADDRKRRPSPRVHHAASYDEEADRLYVFGGTAAYSYKVSHSDFSVSWEFPESAFQSCGLSDVWAYDFGRKRWLLVAGEEEVEPCDVTAIAAGQEGGGAASLRAGGVALLALALASTAAAVA